jgi:hypothetical protein
MAADIDAKKKKHLIQGMLLMVSFAAIFVTLFMPIFGNGKNGLEFADDFFNKLSKGSSYFIPDVAKGVEQLKGKEIDLSIAVKKDLMEKAKTVATSVGLAATVQGEKLGLKGDLGKAMAQLLSDTDAMYHNDGKKVADFYKMEEKDAMKVWWDMLKQLVFELQKKGKIQEANAVNKLQKKALEPAYNFYKIEAEKVTQNIPLLTFLLVFYVIYTLWYGFAIFDLFDGVGLSMKKSKVKKEV